MIPCCEEWGGVLVVCRGPRHRKEYLGRYASARWCYRCQRRRVHELVASVPLGPSYYEPHVAWECPCQRTEYVPLDVLGFNFVEVALWASEGVRDDQ